MACCTAAVAPVALRLSSAAGQILKQRCGASKGVGRVVMVADAKRPAGKAMQALEKIAGEGVSRMQRIAVVAANVMVALPALAEEEKGKLFDFNLTLPIITIQFLLLMLALDNIWFKPVSKIMDERDEKIRKQLAEVRDNSAELKALQDEAEAILRAARVETQAALQKAKKETAAELDAKLQATKAKIEEELANAIANLAKQKEETLKSLDSQVSALSNEIVSKVVPFKV